MRISSNLSGRTGRRSGAPRTSSAWRLLPAAAFAASLLAAGLAAISDPAGAAPEVGKPQMPTLQAPKRQEPTPDAKPVITPDQVPDGALVPGGPPPAVVVFATGDVIGYLEPCG